MAEKDFGLQSILPGMRVEIRTVQEAERAKKTGEEAPMYVSSVYNVTGNDTVELDMPLVKGNYILFSMENIRYELLFFGEKGLFRGVATIENRYRHGKFPVYLFKLAEPIERWQRREFYRLDCYIPLLYVTLSDEAGDIESMKELHGLLQETPAQKRVMGKGTILDISGGGIRFVTTQNLKDVHYLLLRFPIENPKGKEFIEVIGRIKGTSLVEGTDNTTYRIQILFKDSDAQERIVHYIFEEERRIRQKERG